MEQDCYNRLFKYISTGEKPGNMEKREVDSLCRRSKSFLVRDGLLYYIDKRRHASLQVSWSASEVASDMDSVFFLQVITTSQKEQVLEGCHSQGLGGGHFGRDKTLAKLSERYYWVGMVDDVKEFCRTCDKCQWANKWVSYVIIVLSLSS